MTSASLAAMGEPMPDERSAEEILGYGDDGLCG